MQNKQYSQQFIRQRRFLAVLPILVLPFLTFMFWALGGGKPDPAVAQAPKKGFNTQLPGANLKDGKPQDKLSYYEQASADSLKLQQQIKNDPYYRSQVPADPLADIAGDTMLAPAGDTMLRSPRTAGRKGYSDANEDRVYRKLAQLNNAISRPGPPEGYADDPVHPGRTAVSNSDVERLEQMINAMQQNNDPDPEMQQVNGMLGKILDIQHPELVKERLRQQSAAQRGTVMPVTAAGQNNPVNSFYGKREQVEDTVMQLPPRHNGFYSLDDGTTSEDQTEIEAAVHETQTLVNGSTVKLRLTNDVYINGILIPRNTFVFGMAQLNGERLAVKIASIRYRSSLFPVELSVYDMDGLNGLYIPGAITRDVAKQSADRSLQEIGFTPVDPSIGAQAASAGIQAAKTLFGRKVKLIKVTVKAGYKVLLRDEKLKANN